VSQKREILGFSPPSTHRGRKIDERDGRIIPAPLDSADGTRCLRFVKWFLDSVTGDNQDPTMREVSGSLNNDNRGIWKASDSRLAAADDYSEELTCEERMSTDTDLRIKMFLRFGFEILNHLVMLAIVNN
ncbi:LOW QUALITY PROTEIN: hypothetical protein M8C21_003199, partial [Ambrosia artemisiifolia]